MRLLVASVRTGRRVEAACHWSRLAAARAAESVATAGSELRAMGGSRAATAAAAAAAVSITVLACSCVAEEAGRSVPELDPEPEPEPELEPEPEPEPAGKQVGFSAAAVRTEVVDWHDRTTAYENDHYKKVYKKATDERERQQPQPADCQPLMALYPGQDLYAAALRVQALRQELAACHQLQQQGADATAPLPSPLPSLARGRNWPGHYFQVDEFMLWKGAVAALHSAVISTKERLEGNCLCSLKSKSKQTIRKGANGEVVASSDFVLELGKRKTVRQNLFLLAELGLADSILEVGFNAGHSAALFCYGWDMRELRLARGRAAPPEQPAGDDEVAQPPPPKEESKSPTTEPQCSYTGFDLCEHEYAQLCFDALHRVYGDSRQMELVPGDSKITLTAAAAASDEEGKPRCYNMIHIDGGHLEDEITNDILLCRRFAKPGKTLLLIDDATWPAVARSVARFLEDGTLTQVEHSSVGIAPSAMHQLFLYN